MPWYKRKWPYITATIVITLIVVVRVGYIDDTAAIFGRWLLNTVLLGWLLPGGWNLLHATPFFWLIVGTSVLALMAWRTQEVVTQTYDNYRHEGNPVAIPLHELRDRRRTAAKAKRTIKVERVAKVSKRLIRSAIAVGIVAVCLIGYGTWMLNESAARHYIADGKSVFAVANSEDTPSVLGKVARSSGSMVTISEGDISFDWVPRIASATGAVNVMQKTGDAITNTKLMAETVTYIYDNSSQGGSWTAIRNGIKRQTIYGISTWSGTGERVVNCEFKGKYALDRAFDGEWGKNLSNDIAAANPLFEYNANDVYGYCEGDQPVIVIPGTKVAATGVRAVDQANGVMIIKGSPSGDPIIAHVADAKPGDFPGPVYPKRLADSQRESLDWAAGRCWVWEECFGLDTTSVSSQSGNSTNFLLKSRKDGRLYWVTPLKPASTDSQTLVAYSVIPADEVASGQLNQQRVYVMSDGDNRIVNLDDLENVVIDAVRSADPGFFTGDSPGRIVEFLPVSDTKWQVFAEVGGRVKYRIDVSVGARMGTKLFVVDDSAQEKEADKPADPGKSTATTCDNPSSLSDAELARCIGQLASELQKRHK